MKAKFYLIAAAACAALAACSKNEVAPVDVDQEITYQTIETKSAVGFNKTNVFKSYAYFLESGKSWDDDYSTSASEYIKDANIGYIASPTNAWKNVEYNGTNWIPAKTYYWPKQGSLTFFAWSMNDDKVPAITGATVSSPANKGITVTGYDITQNRNRDFLVAEIAKDKTKNETQHESEVPEGTPGGTPWAKGVPTVFKHALSSLAFTVQTVDGEGNAKDYSTEGVTFKVKSIKLTGIETTANYSQDWQNGSAASKHTWTPTGTGSPIPVFTNDSGQEVTETAKPLLVAEASDYTIVIPQTFSTEALEIVYTITTNYTGSDVTETVEYSTAKSNAINLKTKIYTQDWKPGYLYTVAIKFNLDEILWDPSVVEWENGTTLPITL